MVLQLVRLSLYFFVESSMLHEVSCSGSICSNTFGKQQQTVAQSSFAAAVVVAIAFAAAVAAGFTKNLAVCC